HSIGNAAATIESGGNTVDVIDLRLTGSTQDVSGTMHCQNTACRLRFNLASTNAAATLEDFGFRPDLTAARAALDGDLEWRVGPDRPALATLAGSLNMRLEDGATRSDPDPNPQGTPFALLLVPALVNGMGQPTAQAASLRLSEPRGLRFSRLEADFELSAGEALTSDLHFDGDAEILMRGRTGLLARDYDQQVWILRGEGRLPAAVRRLGPTPRMAAAWLSLRELFSGGGREEGSRAALRLRGSWDDPIVVAAD
ncbi:MAG: AsmA-like C-terminal region-containing protein, partial [Steroidobacteraceae bacterium]